MNNKKEQELLEEVIYQFIKTGLFVEWKNGEQIIFEPWTVFGGKDDEILGVFDINHDIIITGTELKRIIHENVKNAHGRFVLQRMARTIVWHVLSDYMTGAIKNGRDMW